MTSPAISAPATTFKTSPLTAEVTNSFLNGSREPCPRRIFHLPSSLIQTAVHFASKASSSPEPVKTRFVQPGQVGRGFDRGSPPDHWTGVPGGTVGLCGDRVGTAGASHLPRLHHQHLRSARRFGVVVGQTRLGDQGLRHNNPRARRSTGSVRQPADRADCGILLRLPRLRPVPRSCDTGHYWMMGKTAGKTGPDHRSDPNARRPRPVRPRRANPSK